jgi:hypothetical protein
LGTAVILLWVRVFYEFSDDARARKRALGRSLFHVPETLFHVPELLSNMPNFTIRASPRVGLSLTLKPCLNPLT